MSHCQPLLCINSKSNHRNPAWLLPAPYSPANCSIILSIACLSLSGKSSIAQWFPHVREFSPQQNYSTFLFWFGERKGCRWIRTNLYYSSFRCRSFSLFLSLWPRHNIWQAVLWEEEIKLICAYHQEEQQEGEILPCQGGKARIAVFRSSWQSS